MPNTIATLFASQRLSAWLRTQHPFDSDVIVQTGAIFADSSKDPTAAGSVHRVMRQISSLIYRLCLIGLRVRVDYV